MKLGENGELSGQRGKKGGVDGEGLREVCRLLYEADLDRRRGLDTVCLERDTITGECI